MPVEESRFDVPSRWGRPATYVHRRLAGGGGRLALILPGYGYTLEAPVLHYAARAALAAGCDVLGVEYGFQANRGAMPREEVPLAVAEIMGALDSFLADHAYAGLIPIAKSIGTLVAVQLAASASLPPPASAVFLTPLRPTIPYMRQALRMTVVVGDRDNLFGPEDIAQIAGLPNIDLHVMAGADHVLEVADDVDGSLAILGATAAACRAACTGSRP